ncbi:MAG TPA: hypothetical protein VIC35_06435 [Acidimicrobiia bacterium]|jgi:hypothetical protein
MPTRLATEEEIDTWHREGWVLIEGLVDTEEIDEAAADLRKIFPSSEEYHADPDAARTRWIGQPPPLRDVFVWPDEGPGFRPEQHRWRGEFPFPGSGALNRMTVHPSIVDTAERLLRTTELRIYQTGVGAKYTGETNYEQPMHTDRNHSWLPPRMEEPWWHLESFLYLCDVTPGLAPTHLVNLSDAGDRDPGEPLLWPATDPEIYRVERPAAGVRGSLLAYRSDVWHRAVDLTEPNGARFLLNVSFRHAGHDWFGFHTAQSRATSPHWVALVEGCTPRELELFGFPVPGHPIWTEELIDATQRRYPKLDLDPWRKATVAQ